MAEAQGRLGRWVESKSEKEADVKAGTNIGLYSRTKGNLSEGWKQGREMT